MDEREEFGIMRKTALYSMKEHIEKEHSYKPNYRKPKMYRSKR